MMLSPAMRRGLAALVAVPSQRLSYQDFGKATGGDATTSNALREAMLQAHLIANVRGPQPDIFNDHKPFVTITAGGWRAMVDGRVEPAFSNGPWVALPPSVAPDDQWHVSNDLDTMVIRFFGFGGDASDSVCEGNARLVAALPDALAALVAASDLLEAVAIREQWPKHYTGWDVIREARAAIQASGWTL